MITHILLDIEGTTCPTSFVSSTLFPYANSHLEGFLNEHRENNEIQSLIDEAWHEWKADHDQSSKDLLSKALRENSSEIENICGYLQHLITIDRKSSALKDLQGKIWREGYEEGDISSSLYPETIEVLSKLKQKGYVLSVYSSGSISAQKLLYRHTTNGDQTALFSHWFDTRTGNKKESKSYSDISIAMNIPVEKVMFVSDSCAECDAAKKAGMSALFSLREGNPEQDPCDHKAIKELWCLFDYLL
ncbi:MULTISPECIES: acireductone synthase [Prochlorococcus]|uniref:acireductone synthase n=1 Tax=Prochlorococcus TaxID=1218 RepID=UPI0007B3F8C4|nr:MULTISPECIES: acireductone synthase [Prochlorococcus]KZR67764.1 Enolase-phosphatase E1 [Prochlorococcus marinus str. MIT 1312]KZR81639.1 Enolase-phosphatase E1 [Prochlorococcus marinus str. MIT 1327]NMO83557.1 acireductone synthase [Prochlorococcus sp. P1344]NMP05365.1 acireductone synthase [Prochlorococcus sp. P1361]NMP13344.1 acireductone synthase [Prochlorococcus sp.P1363]